MRSSNIPKVLNILHDLAFPLPSPPPPLFGSASALDFYCLMLRVFQTGSSAILEFVQSRFAVKFPKPFAISQNYPRLKRKEKKNVVGFLLIRLRRSLSNSPTDLETCKRRRVPYTTRSHFWSKQRPNSLNAPLLALIISLETVNQRKIEINIDI